MTTRPTGRRETRDGEDVVVFTRTFQAPIADVWAAVTEPDRLARWIGTWEGDPANGYVEFRMTAEAKDAPAERRWIDVCDPPRRLVTRSTLSMEGLDMVLYLELDLAEREGVTTLTFAQRVSDAETAASFGPGWEYYLDRLVAAETGGDLVTPADFDGYLQSGSEYYRRLFA